MGDSQRSHFRKESHTKSSKSKMALRYGTNMLLRSTMRSSPIPKRCMSQMAFTFAAPNGVFYNAASVKQVDVPSFSGAFGILPNHVPTLAVLKPGVVTVYEDDGSTNKFFVSSGSVSINEDASVQILAEEVHKVEDIDAAAAKDLVAKAAAKVSAAADETAKAEAQIELEVGEALVAASS